MIDAMTIGGIDANGVKTDIAYIGYWKHISQDGGVADVALPGSFIPSLHSDGLFGFELARVNLRCLGLEVEANALEAQWRTLCDEGMLLQEVMASCVVSDVAACLMGVPSKSPGMVHRWSPSVPGIAKVIKLVGHIAAIRQIPSNRCEGFERRITELRRSFRGIFRRTELLSSSIDQFDWNFYVKRSANAADAVTAKESEFNVLEQLLNAGHTVRLPDSGPDFEITDVGSLTVEVKGRHEDYFHKTLALGIEHGIIKEPFSMTPELLFSLLSWSVFASLSRATEEQKADVVFCDLSHTFVGALLPATESFWNLDMDFDRAMSQAWDIHASGEQAVVAFVSLPGVDHVLKAIVFRKNEIQATGKLTWELNRELKLSSPELAALLAQRAAIGTFQ